MAAVVRCPRCSRGYRLEKTDENRVLRCRRCNGEIRFAALAGGGDAPAKRRPKGGARGRAAELTWAAVGLRVGAVLAGLAALTWFLLRGPDGPPDRLFAALDAELTAITEAVAGIETLRDSEAARPDLNARVAAFNRLLDDPHPYGAPREEVGPAVWEKYGPRLTGRLIHLRREKSRVFRIRGAGRAVSATLSQLPQADSLLRKRLTEPLPVGTGP